jgi:hypothetical protein
MVMELPPPGVQLRAASGSPGKFGSGRKRAEKGFRASRQGISFVILRNDDHKRVERQGKAKNGAGDSGSWLVSPKMVGRGEKLKPNPPLARSK